MKIACSLLVLAFIAACAQQTEVIHLRDVPDGYEKQYSNLLVVSVASEIAYRRQLEELLTNELEMVDVAATASYTHTGLHPTILQDALTNAAKKSGAQAILMTHIANIQHELDIDKGMEHIMTECRGGDPVNAFIYNTQEIRESDDVKLAHTVVVISNLYDVETDERIWTIQSTCFDKASMHDVLHEEAAAIVRQLRIDKLIP